MRLQPVGLRGRKFMIQFHEIMSEFGRTIPWLDGMNELRFATNAKWFEETLLRRLGQREGNITPYQFVDTDNARTYIGGILHFTQNPEQLQDCRNKEIMHFLTSQGASFISCLQVRRERRMVGVGNLMMSRALRAIQVEHGAVWGVVSNSRLLPWYISLGAQTPSPLENKDRLWIVHWPNPTFTSL